MNIELTIQQKMMCDMVREFAAKEIAPLDAQMDKDGAFPRSLLEKMIANGFLGVMLPRQYGGAGADALIGALATWELARASASVAITMNAHWLGADIICTHGSEAQKQKYLPQAAQNMLTAFALTEPNAGSDAASISASARLEGDVWILNGTKAWCTNGGLAGLYIIMAKTDKSKGAKGISAFIVEEGTPGFSVGKKEDKMGMRGSHTTELVLNNCRVNKENMLGKEGDGFKIAMQALDGSRISFCAIATGICEHAIAEAKSYAKERRAFGQPIANFQAVQFMIADMAIGLHAVKLMLFDTASQRAAGKAHSLDATIGKIFSSVHAVKTCLDAIQVLGGNGYSRDNAPERLLRDAKVLELGDGPTEVLKMIVGRTEINS